MREKNGFGLWRMTSVKMVVAIVQDKDVSKLLERITQAGFGATKLASSGRPLDCYC